MRRIQAAALGAALLAAGCGYVGSPLPPLANVPLPPTSLAAVQRNARIIVHFTLPLKTTERMPVKPPLDVDVRVGPSGSSPDQWKPVTGGSVTKGLATYEIPTAPWTGQEVTIAVRAVGANRKPSGWATYEHLPVAAPPPTPTGLRAEATAEGVRLTWEGASGDYRIFRRAGDEQGFARAGEAGESIWVDHGAEYGTGYTYMVQRIVKLGADKEAESDPSGEVSITPVDTFPPATPAALHASAAPNSIELSWERNTEPDLAGYRVYRSVAGGAFEKVAEVSQIPSYSDPNVEHGKTYRYAVSAFDQAGNESSRSQAGEVTLP